MKRSVIYQDLCTRCGGCAASCPVNALSFGKDGIELVGDCIECGTC
ncbi:MAG: 4Fe-4S binding protein, partial [Candidatus Thermoplasmatota archaeon]|nr:4Fe-4S binding protein [Candidatus Thermoplasmatota archaeon]